MRIEKVTIRNFKGIESLDVNIAGRNVFVMGPNASGKTSFLDAIWGAITGQGLPDKPVTTGKKKALVEVDLQDYIARMTFADNKDKRTFELERKDAKGEADKFVPSPRTFLNEAIKIVNFDISTFFGKTGIERVKYLCKVVGLNFSEIEGQIEEAEEMRKLDKKKLTSLKNLFNFYDRELAERELIDIVELSKRIAAETEKQNTYERIQTGVNDRKLKLMKLQAEVNTLQLEIVDGDEWLADEANKPLDSEKYGLFNTELNTANDTNAKIQDAKTQQQREAEMEAVESNIEALATSIDDLRREKAKQLKAALNVPELELDPMSDVFTWNGLPFEDNQINTAEQIIAGLKIGSTLLGDLRILKFDGSLIDKKNFERIKEFAAHEKIELFIEFVDRDSEKLEITMED